MDRRGRRMDNVFIEQLWRSLKHEDVYLKGYADGREARRGYRRPPSGARAARADGGLARRRSRLEGCGHDGQRCRVAHMPTAATADAAFGRMIGRNWERSDFQLTNRFKRSRCAGPLYLYYRLLSKRLSEIPETLPVIQTPSSSPSHAFV